MIQNKDLEIFSKTTKIYELKFKNKVTGAVENITGWTIYFTVKENMQDTDANAKIKKVITTHSDPTVGKTLIELSITDTDLSGSYYYSIDFKDDDDNVGILFSGRIIFIKPVLNTKI